MTNADRIRSMTDEQLCHFLWTWECNSLALFFEKGFTDHMNALQLREWLKREGGFIIPMTEVPEEMVYDQDFNLKEESK